MRLPMVTVRVEEVPVAGQADRDPVAGLAEGKDRSQRRNRFGRVAVVCAGRR